MSKSHAFCDRQHRHVSVEQTEGQCRDAHNCSDDICPLERNFNGDRFSQTLSLLAASIGQPLSPTKGS
jgi:hypothetical protein